MPRWGGGQHLGKAASKSLVVRPYGQRSSIGDPELAIDAVQVDLHGAFGQLEPSSDFRVGYTSESTGAVNHFVP
jgi:hypothetical protein